MDNFINLLNAKVLPVANPAPYDSDSERNYFHATANDRWVVLHHSEQYAD